MEAIASNKNLLWPVRLAEAMCCLGSHLSEAALREALGGPVCGYVCYGLWPVSLRWGYLEKQSESLSM